ncbi:hypothetical protein MPHL43072_08295 [Mycolicibacterium phlei DSM 43072]|nr:hypothetical protein MPHL43072_08295 [Mycolicibacterium phlei DSM 43072]KXW71392.1 hypothetical protein MPHL43070_16460 [Mycolicibacterium phlei DSM 43070]
MAVAIAGHSQRIDRVHLIPGAGQCLHPQSAVGFDSDGDLSGVIGVGRDEIVQ